MCYTCSNERTVMAKELKPEYRPGGAQRHVILDKAVKYLLDPRDRDWETI